MLAIDYGRRRLGLAISDALGIMARPLATFERVNRRKDVQHLREIVREHGARCIVVGCPVHLDGTPGEMAAEAARFAGRLRKQLGVPVELVEERLSSWEAEQMLGELRAPTRSGRRAPSGGAGGRVRARGRPPVDHLAAAIILRDYLDHQRPTASSSAESGGSPRGAGAKRGRG